MIKELVMSSLSSMKDTKCWSVIGPSTGSIVSFGFGNKILRDNPLKNEMLNFENRRYKPEFDLLIYCAWRIENEFEIFVGSENTYDEIFDKLNILQDLKMVDYSIEEPAFDLKIFFENNLILNVFCTNTNPDEIETNYDLYIPNGCITVGCNGMLSFEEY